MYLLARFIEKNDLHGHSFHLDTSYNPLMLFDLLELLFALIASVLTPGVHLVDSQHYFEIIVVTLMDGFRREISRICCIGNEGSANEKVKPGLLNRANCLIVQ